MGGGSGVLSDPLHPLYLDYLKKTPVSLQLGPQDTVYFGEFVSEC